MPDHPRQLTYFRRPIAVRKVPGARFRAMAD